MQVDGTPAEALRVNYGFLGVVLEPGSHEIEWRFTPFGLRAGLMISGLAVLILLAWTHAGRSRD